MTTIVSVSPAPGNAVRVIELSGNAPHIPPVVTDMPADSAARQFVVHGGGCIYVSELPNAIEEDHYARAAALFAQQDTATATGEQFIGKPAVLGEGYTLADLEHPDEGIFNGDDKPAKERVFVGFRDDDGGRADAKETTISVMCGSKSSRNAEKLASEIVDMIGEDAILRDDNM